MNSKKLILFIAASPDTHSDTDWNAEYRVFRKTIWQTSLRNKYVENLIPNATAKDIIDFRFTNCWIVHISAHGSNCGNIILESEDGTGFVPRPRNLLEVICEAGKPKCLVFNSCDSAALAELSMKYVDYAIGVNGKISNESAIQFVRHFYEAFGDYETIPMAFKVAYNAAAFRQLKEIQIVINFKNSKVMNLILQGKREELQNLQIENEPLRKEIAALERDIKKAEAGGLKDVFNRLMVNNPFPREVFWFVECKEELAHRIGRKVFAQKSEEEQYDFSTNLYALFQILDAYLVTNNLNLYSKAEIMELNTSPKKHVESALNELIGLVPEPYYSEEFLAYFKDNIKFFKKMLL